MIEEDFINKIFPQKCGDNLLVIEKTNEKVSKSSLYRCKFLNKICEVKALKQHIKTGSVANYLIPSVCSIGYLGLGKYNKKDYKCIYSIWIHLLQRCYDIKCDRYKVYGNKFITVCEEWHNFQNFASWYENNIKWNTENYKLELDKDILCNVLHKDIKIYSPETCLLIPEELNVFLTGDTKNCGLNFINNKYYPNIQFNKERKYLGVFSSFKEAKQVYAEEKYKIWVDLINKYLIPNNLKEILLKYDFNWSWIN